MAQSSRLVAAALARCAAPIERCLDAGDAETGVQLMVMEADLILDRSSASDVL